MNRTSKLSLSILCFFTCFLLAASGLRARDDALANDLAPKILRFHVLANSDSAADQALKLLVKDFLLERIRSEAGNTDKESLKTYIRRESSTLEAFAEDFIHSQGYDYGVKVGIETCRFPVRVYGDLRFPAGTYEAVRVIIGNGAGHNFWCVLYPSLCYTDTLHAVMPDASKDTLKTLITEEDFQALSASHARLSPDTFSNSSELAPSSSGHKKSGQESSSLPTVKIRFRIASLFSGN